MTVLVSDSFNRANSTTSLGTTDSYAGGTAKTWAVFGTGTYGIISNQAYAPSGSGHNVAYVDAGQSDVTITVTFAAYDMAGSGGAKIGLRIVDNENMVNIQARTDGIVIYYYSGGSSTTVNDTAGTLVAGDVIKVIASGTSIKVYRNGTLFSSATVALNQTATKHGINAQTYPAARFDNFMIEDVVTPVALTSTVKSNSTQTATPTKTGTMDLSSTVKSNTTQVGNLTKAGTFLLNSTVKSNTTQTSHVTSTTSGVLVSDSFNRADSTTTMGTPDNYAGGTITPVPVWTTLGTGAYGIISNQAYCPTQPDRKSVV